MFERAIKLLEYDKIKNQLQSHAASSLGREKVGQLKPEGDLNTVQAMIDETEEAFQVLRVRGHLPFGGITDVRPFLKRAQIGSVLAARELVAVSDVIRGTRIIKNFILETVSDQELVIPTLESLALDMQPETSLEKSINTCVDVQGFVLDGASEKLRGIRTQIRSFEGRIKDKLENIIRSASTQKMLSESLVTIRGNRYVVPVKQEYRHAFGGIVHDQSASGATLFIEPQSVVDINNQLSEARSKEKHEIERILTELSAKVALVAETILLDVDRLAQIDFSFAKAKYGRALKGSLPRLRDDGKFRIRKACHPLIPYENVVPIDMELGPDTHSVIITGPNTGGKTVTLKTVGLLTLMAQSGLYIPAEDGSEINVFERVFADIGDEQSIEQSLSTFSSHMTNIVSILDNINFKSLALFDELGAGTDPQEGAALSIAILDDVFTRGATVIATTHYSELKAYAYDRKGVENASVEFDVETLSPTYRLLMGVPGRSNAFEISKKLGLPERIIQESRNLIGSDTAKIDKMIESLENSRKEAEAAEIEAKKYQAESVRLKTELEKQLDQFENEKETLLHKAEMDALEKVEKAKREAYEIIKELRKMRQGESNVKEHELIDAKTRMDEAINSLSNETKKSKRTYKKKESRDFKPGEEVKVSRFGQNGHIVEKINDHEYLVQIGIMKMNLDAGDLKKVKSEETVKPIVNVKTASTMTPRTELDLRGERYEEAMNRVDKFLDDALLAGFSRVSIIHGKGTGALRNGVKQKLKRHPRVKEARLGVYGEGDSGVTIVEFK